LAIPALPFFPGPSGVSLLRLFLEEPLPIVVLSGVKYNIFRALFMTFSAKFPDYSHGILAEKQKLYAQYREARAEMRELLTVKSNIDLVTEPQGKNREIVR